MLYSLSTDFTKLNETQGTVQNSSNIYTLELSDSTEPDSGVLIFPLNKLSFNGTKYLRCIDGNSQARVVSFAEVNAQSSYAASSSTDDDVADVIDDIWNSAGDSSSLESDEFSDVLDDIFNGNSSP